MRTYTIAGIIVGLALIASVAYPPLTLAGMGTLIVSLAYLAIGDKAMGTTFDMSVFAQFDVVGLNEHLAMTWDTDKDETIAFPAIVRPPSSQPLVGTFMCLWDMETDNEKRGQTFTFAGKTGRDAIREAIVNYTKINADWHYPPVPVVSGRGKKGTPVGIGVTKQALYYYTTDKDAGVKRAKLIERLGLGVQFVNAPASRQESGNPQRDSVSSDNEWELPRQIPAPRADGRYQLNNRKIQPGHIVHTVKDNRYWRCVERNTNYAIVVPADAPVPAPAPASAPTVAGFTAEQLDALKAMIAGAIAESKS